MKQGLVGTLEVVGIDDGFFPPHFKGRGLRTVIAAVYCVDTFPIDVRISTVTVDFDDVDTIIVNLINSFKRDVTLILLDGVTYAGFNVVNPYKVHNSLGIPIIVIFKHELRLEDIKSALINHFTDWSRRFNIINKVYSSSIEVVTKWKPIRVFSLGIPIQRAIDIVMNLQVTSSIPEPLRLADVVASGLTRSKDLLSIINKLSVNQI